jgi:hypothetical protein
MEQFEEAKYRLAYLNLLTCTAGTARESQAEEQGTNVGS